MWGEDAIRSPGIKITHLEWRREPAGDKFRTEFRKSAPLSTSSDSRPPGESDRKETAWAGSKKQADGKNWEEGSEQEGKEAVADADEGSETHSKVSSEEEELTEELIEAWKHLKGNTKVKKEVAISRSPFSFYSSVILGFWRWCSSRISVLQLKYSFDFDEEEFLQGAETAFYTVNGLFTDGDLDALEPLVHDQILQAMRKTCDMYKKQDVRVEMDIQDVYHKQIVSGGLIYYASRSGRETDFLHNQMYLSVRVRFDSCERIRLYHKARAL